MPTTNEVSDIIATVKNKLVDAQKEGIFLEVSGENLDDDWLYIAVVTTRQGVRASEHADFMSKIERELREAGHDNVLLVPAIEE